ncbi:uncharacterized protein VTP21DRAFT_970 [Calcarisporiella thermophila]|uniref:uncharacterized protein n=1 Tax=Calcarisporiella thermophila TaxID=911321 RepID=UPI003743AFC7
MLIDFKIAATGAVDSLVLGKAIGTQRVITAFMAFERHQSVNAFPLTYLVASNAFSPQHAPSTCSLSILSSTAGHG